MTRCFLIFFAFPSLCFAACCGSAKLGADFLYWQPFIGEQSWASEQQGDTYNIKEISPKFEAGFRFRYAKENAFGPLALSASYSYIKSDVKDFAVASEESIQSTHLHFIDIDNSFDVADTHWQMHAHLFDAGFAKTFYCGDFTSTIFLGATGFLIDQESKSRFASSAQLQFFDVLWKTESLAGGVKLGFSTKRKFSCFDLYVEGSGSYLKTFPTQIDETLDAQEFAQPRQIATFREKQKTESLTALHVGVGIEKSCFFCDALLSIRAGYELLAYGNFFSQSSYIASNNETAARLRTPGNIGRFGFHGPRLGGDISF